MNLDQRTAAAVAALREAVAAHPQAAFSSSFGVEDMVILDLIARHGIPAEVFTLDTGRLHQETLALVERARGHYGLPVRVLYPDGPTVEAFVTAEGPDAFYRSVQLRKRCCAVRKLEPLSRALAGRTLWITGLRREQSVTRIDVQLLEHDRERGLLKLNPLVEWSGVEVAAYVERHEVPVNPLHARGFPSIGCAPCTRAVAAGEDERAGRWWWEQPASRECGLHVTPDGRLMRAASPA